MKISSIIYKSVIILIVFGFLSCEKEIHLDLRSVSPRLNIEATIPCDSLARVRITKTKDFNSDDYYPAVEDAVVTISDGNGNSDILQLDAVSGLYKSDKITGVEGMTYYLTVEYDNEEYTSVSTMPYAVQIDSVSMYYIPAFEEAFPMVYFKDPAGIENYYRYKLSINNKRMPGIDVSSDEDRDGKEIARILPVDSDYLENDKISKGDTIFVETQFLDKGAHTYFRDLSRIGMNMTNPESNIRGGALGYFSAYSFNQTTIIADWKKK